jgi:signal transduction histidine kinase
MKDGLAERILASMRCGVVTVDAGGRVTSVNDQAAENLEVAAGAVLGVHCREAFESCPQVAHLLLSALQRETLPDRAELEIRLGSGRKVLVGFSLSRVDGRDGNPLGSAIFFKDLTLVEEERERQALRNRLANLGEVSAELAHELRNLLGGVRVFVGLARRRLQEDPQGRGYLDRAEEELLEANGKLRQILDFVRPLEVDCAPLDLEAVVRDALEGTLGQHVGAEVQVGWRCDRRLPAVTGDAVRLRDAFSNLFANAVEAMGERGSLQVTLRAEAVPVLVASGIGASIPGVKGFGERRGFRVRAEISDDGPGMAPDVLRRIFQPFFTTKASGSGLGVPLAQKIVDAHGGVLDAFSEAGGGCTMTVILPASPEDPTHG